MKPADPPGATPLPSDWERDLIPSISTMAELDELEQENILSAVSWAFGNTRFCNRLLSVDGLRRLHGRMFDSVWTWAGTFRTRNLNIGVEWGYIQTQLRDLCDDVQYWIDHDTYEWVEIAVRFHHRLVKIHAFENGNGRHARIAPNLLLEHHGHPALPWGNANLATRSDVRDRYIEALHAADREKIEPLLAFAQSTS